MAEYDVVIVPSFSQVEDWRKHAADSCRGGVFAQTVTTFNAWIADLWELHGDGRSIVDSLKRLTIMQAAFEDIGVEADDDVLESAASGDAESDGMHRVELTASSGVVAVAARCVRDASGVPAFERVLDEVASSGGAHGITPREALFLSGIVRYRQLIASADFVELGQAAAYLVEHAAIAFPRTVRVLAYRVPPLDWRMQCFFDSIGNLELEVMQSEGDEGIGPVPENVDLRFAFPSGRYAQPGLVADRIRDAIERMQAPHVRVSPAREAGGQEHAEQGRDKPFSAVVACKDPLGMYKQLEDEFARMGVRGCVQAQVPFGSTDFGRALLALSRVAHNEAWSKDDLSDAALPPFSGYDKAESIQIDAELRRNRLAQRDESLAWLRVNSDTFSQLEEIALDPEADILMGVFEQIAFKAPGRSDAWRAEQLAAASAVRSCTSAARSVGAGMRSCIRVLENTMVTVSYEGACEGECEGARVVVTSQAAAAQLGAGSCNQAIVCDLTAGDYPVADKDDAAATLFAKIGLFPADTALARMRRTFASLQALPCDEMVCVRPLNDYDGNPTYPAAPLQELIDAHCGVDGMHDGLDEVFGIPEPFLATMVQRGEELLFANAGARDDAAVQPNDCRVPVPDAGDAPADARRLMALPRRASDGRIIPGFSPSPSQVEAYLSCPYKWFVQSRVNVEQLDEQFGPLARGTFAHEVLQTFYRRFQEVGCRKVSDGNLEQARRLMREVAEEVQGMHREMPPGSGRYVAANQIEARELEACKAQLVSYLDFEAKLLPGFHPAYLEFAIKPDAGATYAGHGFVGTVDRIDVDDAGNAVVIDYKGSVTSIYEIAGKGPADPGKVQARMYAQVVQRLLGLRVVGALYVSYGKSAGCAGAYDGAVLESAHLPAMKHDRCSCALSSPSNPAAAENYAELTFQDMLDETEHLVGRAIEQMESGEVQPCPVAGACDYCPAAMCPKRGA